MRVVKSILGVFVFVPMFCSQVIAGSEIPTSGSVAAPPGFSSACERYGWLCQGSGGSRIGDAEALRVLREVNQYVNARITPVKDSGRPFYWSIGKSGDCKDYALSKMRTLLDIGFPTNRLALSVVLDHDGGNHMVLLARLNSGDYVLDNLNSSVKPWRRTGYTFLASQNFHEKGSWQVTLAGPRAGQFY